MTIELKLDTPSVASLFPEGSEMRLKLQNAVVENITKRYLKGVGEDVTRRLDQLSRNAADEACREFTQTISGRVRLSNSLTDRIKSDVEVEVHAHISRSIDASIEAYLAENNIDKMISAKLDYKLNSMIDAQARDVVRRRLTAALNAVEKGL